MTPVICLKGRSRRVPLFFVLAWPNENLGNFVLKLDVYLVVLQITILVIVLL